MGGEEFAPVCVLGFSEKIMEIGSTVASGLWRVKFVPKILGNEVLSPWSSETDATGAGIGVFPGLKVSSLGLTSVILSEYEESRVARLVSVEAEEW